MIQEKSCTIYLAPTKGRRYFTAKAAARAEAGAIVQRKYPSENTEHDDIGRVTYGGFHFTEEPRLVRLRDRIAKSLLRQLRTKD